MPTDKKNLSYRIVDRAGDLTKKWYVEYYNAQGRQRKYGDINSFQTASERRRAAEKLIEQLKGNIAPVSNAATPQQKIYAWLDAHRGRMRKKSYQTIKSKFDNLFRWLKQQNRKLGEESVRDFMRWVAANKSSGTHAAYVRHLKIVLRGVGEIQLLGEVEKVKHTHQPARYFQRHQIGRIKEHILAHEPELWLFIEFVYYCFIRPGELRLLRVDDIIFDGWKIHVRAEVSKNRKAQYVTIPEAFRDSLLHLRHRGPSEYIFGGVKPVAINYMARHHRNHLKKLGFSNEYKLYSWKHTGAVMAVKAGVSVKDLQIQLRHHSLDETDKYLRQLGAMDLGQLEQQFPGL